MKYEELDPSLLKPNPWNSNIVSPENEDKLEQSIERFGMFKPVVVRTLKDGTLQILGGEHRAEVAANTGLEKVPVINLGEIPDKKAKEISLIDNGRYGTDDTLKLAELLEDIGTDDFSLFAPYSDAELESIFSAKSIDFDELGFDDEEDLPSLPEATSSTATSPSQQIMRFKVAIDDSEMVTELLDFIMKTQKFDSEDSLTNAGDALVFLAGKYRELITSED